MTWKDLKREIIELGFEKNDVFRGDETRIRLAGNRALSVMASTFRGKMESCEYEFTGESFPNLKNTEPAFLRYLKPCLTDAALNPIVCRISPGGNLLTDYRGTGLIHYETGYDKVEADASDDYVIGLDEETSCLLPLLSAFYVWQDDDERKAVRYRNDYEELKAEFLKRMTDRVQINEGDNI